MAEDWYVNFGEFGKGRAWDDARRLGFVSGGWGRWYSATLRKVPVGARIWVYRAPMAGRSHGLKVQGGYIGRGVVTGEAVTAEDAEFEVYGRRATLRELQESGDLTGNYFGWTSEEDAEYVVPVRWERVVSPSRPLMEPGLFTNQNTAVRFDESKPVHARTLRFLRSAFAVEGD